MEKSHKNIIESYAVICHRQLVVKNLWMEREDLEGEFYVCYVKALKMFREGGNAKFETYLISAINNRFSDIRNKLIYEARCGYSLPSWGSSNDIAAEVEVKDAISKLFSTLTPKEKIIVDDMLSPSPDILEFIPPGCSPRKYMGHLQEAISEVRGFPYNEVKYCLQKIRKKVRKVLTIK